MLEIAGTMAAIDASTIISANEAIAENKVWTNAYRSNIQNWITEYHDARGGEEPTISPTGQPTEPTGQPTDPTDSPSSSTIISLSAVLVSISVVLNLWK